MRCHLANRRSARRCPALCTALLHAVAWTLLAAGAGCSGSGAAADCDDDDPPAVPAAPDTALVRSQVKLETRAKYDASGAAEAADNLASAVFVDSSRVQRVMRSVNDQKFSMTCAGLTGAPIDQCREPYKDPDCVRVQLEVDEVRIGGVPGGLTLEKKGAGTYVNATAPEPLFGKEELKVEVRSKAGDPAYFLPYEQALTPPPALAVAEPRPGQAVGDRDLAVRWNGGGGDVIEIAIQIERADPNATPDTDKVVCLVKDDGCHTVPASAFDWLRLGQLAPDDRFKVSITREKTAVQSLDDKTATELKAAHNVELLLPQE